MLVSLEGQSDNLRARPITFKKPENFASFTTAIKLFASDMLKIADLSSKLR